MTNFAFEGPTWSTQTVTWSFASAGGDITDPIAGAYQSIVRAAISAWAHVVNLNIQEVAPGTAGVDIKVGFGQFAGSQIGNTEYSYTPGTSEHFTAGTEVLLEDPTARAIGNAITSDYQGTSTTMYEVALHEFGHALGLDHSTDPNAVMYESVGQNNNGLGASDIAGIQALYGAPAAATVAQSIALTPATTTILPQAVNLAAGKVAVYRFFDSHTGTQFLTASTAERDSVIATRSDLTYEGLGLTGITPGTDASAVPVYRFFDTQNGTHFFTTSQAEEASIAATQPNLVLEQSSFYEHSTQQAGDSAVYRFFDKADGTHFFTASAVERASIIATRPDMAFEGVAFYAPSAT